MLTSRSAQPPASCRPAESSVPALLALGAADGSTIVSITAPVLPSSVQTVPLDVAGVTAVAEAATSPKPSPFTSPAPQKPRLNWLFGVSPYLLQSCAPVAPENRRRRPRLLVKSGGSSAPGSDTRMSGTSSPSASSTIALERVFELAVPWKR